MNVVIYGATGMVGQGVLENVGKAMINVSDKGFEKRLLEGRDIDEAAALG